MDNLKDSLPKEAPQKSLLYLKNSKEDFFHGLL
jgi:hypothetical protein